MTDSRSEPLVWLPFPPDELGDLPGGLRYEHFDADGDLPASADEVELYVLPYRFRPADGEVLAQLPKLKVIQTMSAGIEHIASYVPDDAPVAFRGTAPAGPGFWFPPTVLAPTDPRDRTLTAEIFGPVVAVVPFEDEADAVRIANEGEYGLSGSIWTRDIGRGLRVARGVAAGNLSVNSHSSVRYSTPFGGFKQSGIGRELGPDALEAFTEVKNVFISTD